MPIILLSPFNWEMKFEEAPLEHSTLKYDLSLSTNKSSSAHTLLQIFFLTQRRREERHCMCAYVCVFACLYSKTHIIVVFPFPSWNYPNEGILWESQTVSQASVTLSFSNILITPLGQIALLLKAAQFLNSCYMIGTFIFLCPHRYFLSWTGPSGKGPKFWIQTPPCVLVLAQC